MITLLAARDRNGCIGKDNSIPWRSKEDFAHFFKYTTGKGKILLMGRKTWESLPEDKLPGRYKIVLSKTLLSEKIVDYPDTFFARNFLEEGTSHLQEIFDFHPSTPNFELIVIGGSKIFSQFINLADQVILTDIDSETSDCDSYFPNIENLGFHIVTTTILSDMAVVNTYKYKGKTYNAGNNKI